MWDCILAGMLTLALLGGGPFWPPLWFFPGGAKTAARSAAKFSVPLSASILHMYAKFETKGHHRSWVIEVKPRSCSTKNETKSSNLWTPLKGTVFEQIKLFLRRFVENWLLYKTAISDFQNFDFSKKYFQKSQLFGKFWIFSKFSKNFKNPENAY